ncbi:uncharacterized protein [Temnothorax nylanderi]|uniref:uncharacterized protein isoform X2 n=1 Tax=Temnothorax nylanderi TaxID=102681 RepID=UPI003A893402
MIESIFNKHIKVVKSIVMAVTCSVKGCKSKHQGKLSKDGIRFYRFPISNEKILKYWVAATGRSNWIAYSNARMCSLHFTNNDYYKFHVENNQRRRLKPDVIPTQNIYRNMLQVFQQDIVYKINEYDQNNDIIPAQQNLNEQDNKHITSAKYDQNNDIIPVEQNLNEKDNKPITSAKCSNCSNYDKLLSENENLQKKIKELKILQEKKLNWQASIFHTIIRDKEAVLKKKLEMAKNKTKTLNKNIKRKEKTLTNLKTLLEFLESKNISKTDAAFNLSNESDDLSDALLKNIKRNKAKSTYSQHDEHNYACSGESLERDE